MNTYFVRIGLLATAGSLVFWPATGTAAVVTFGYTATIATVTGSPFGYSVEQARTQPVTGHFSYDTDTLDTNVADPGRGYYPHISGGGFLATFLGTVVTGSATPHVRIENLSSDTFRFYDGPLGSPAGGMMSVNGAPDSTVRVSMAFTASSAFSSDALPANLAFANPPLANPVSFPHTFVIEDSGGKLLLQMSTLTAVPEPSGAALVALGLAAGCFRRCRRTA
jgi:hypothetical protein